MLRRTYLFVSTVLVLLLAPFVLYAANFFADEEITLPEPVEDDVYFAGRSATITHDVSGDLIGAGESLSVMASVRQDAVLAGDTVTIEGSIGDDLRAAGSQVSFVGDVGDDAFLAGELVTVGLGTTVHGDAFIAAREARIRGTFDGTLRLAGESLSLESGTVVHGDVITYGERPAVADGVDITGTVRHVPFDRGGRQPHPLARWVVNVLVWFVTSYLLVWLFPRFTSHVLQLLRAHPVRSGVIGLAWIFLWLPVVVVLLITVVGIPLAVMLACVTAFFVVVSTAYALTGLGVWVIHALRGSRVAAPSSDDKPQELERVSWQHVLLGAVLFKSVQLVPVVGWLALIILVIATFGAVVRTAWRFARTS